MSSKFSVFLFLFSVLLLFLLIACTPAQTAPTAIAQATATAQLLVI